MYKISLSLLVSVLICTGCAGVEITKADKQQYIRDMRQQFLDEIYDEYPIARQQASLAAGYAFFSNINPGPLELIEGSSYGVARDNTNGADIFMKMASPVANPELGAEDFQALIIFKQQSDLNQFIAEGWDLSGQADATSAAPRTSFDVISYQFTENGVVLQARLEGARYWKDDELN